MAAGYQAWPDKGDVVDGARLTVMAARTTYGTGEAIRVVHVVEVVEAGRPVYVMGPKPVAGEEVDGAPTGGAPPAEGDPLVPADYDGATVDGPAVDDNYDVTLYRFGAAGTHEIRWNLGRRVSNTLQVAIVEAPDTA
ncbi:MAG: hypothetical protein ACRDZW_02770 [Acidimicrobiales bacterium]